MYNIDPKKILLAHVAWMKYYDGNETTSDIPQSNCKWTRTGKMVHEIFNFRKTGSRCFGFVEPQSNKTGINLNKVGQGTGSTENVLNNVLVVFLALNKNAGKGVTITGFYKNATVYRHEKEYKGADRIAIAEPNMQYGYNLECAENDAFLIPTQDRMPFNTKYTIRRPKIIYNIESTCNRDELLDYVYTVISGKTFSLEGDRPNIIEQFNVLNGEELKKREERPVRSAMVNGQKRFNIDPSIGRTALENAGYVCACCGKNGGFVSKRTGQYYVEAHHLIRMPFAEDFERKYGCHIDQEANISPLCPNCHRGIHYATEKERMKFVTKIYNAFQRSKYAESPLRDVTLEEIKALYKD